MARLRARVLHDREARFEHLRALLRIVRARYGEAWRRLVAAVGAAGENLNVVADAIETWLREHRLLDQPENLAVLAAFDVLVNEPELPALRRGRAALAFMRIVLRDFLPKNQPPPAVLLEARYLIGEGMVWAYGVDFDAYRARILGDFEKKLDAALAEYRRNLEAAGLRVRRVSRVERERLELLADYLLGRHSVEKLAAERRLADREPIRRALAAAARECGLRLRPPGRPKKTSF